MRLLCFTWNVGNAEPDEQELRHWLPREGGDFDLVVVGTQENRYKPGSKRAPANEEEEDDEDSEKEEDGGDEPGVFAGRKKSAPSPGASDSKIWGLETMVLRRLGNGWGVCKLITMWQMRLAVFAREPHLVGETALIRGVQASRSATGIGHVGGNKGGLVVALTYGQVTLCFVSAHLAAHSHRLAARHSNCQEILNETRAHIGNSALDVAHEFDHVIWMGDLNYRLQPDIHTGSRDGAGSSFGPGSFRADGGEAASAAPAAADGAGGASHRRDSTKAKERKKLELAAHHATVTALAEASEWGALMEIDQLTVCRERGEVFAGFVEGPIHWRPTFKVRRVGGLQYKDQRVPSYCDRVLWKSMPPLAHHLEQTEYRAVPEVSTSDHKPVLSAFTIRPPSTPMQLTPASDPNHGCARETESAPPRPPPRPPPSPPWRAPAVPPEMLSFAAPGAGRGRWGR